jgi:hypothetical protein
VTVPSQVERSEPEGNLGWFFARARLKRRRAAVSVHVPRADEIHESELVTRAGMGSGRGTWLFASVAVKPVREEPTVVCSSDVGWYGGTANRTCGPLPIQPCLLHVEETSDVMSDFSKLLWIFFNLCQSAVVLKLISGLMVHRLPPNRNR